MSITINNLFLLLLPLDYYYYFVCFAATVLPTEMARVPDPFEAERWPKDQGFSTPFTVGFTNKYLVLCYLMKSLEFIFLKCFLHLHYHRPITSLFFVEYNTCKQKIPLTNEQIDRCEDIIITCIRKQVEGENLMLQLTRRRYPIFFYLFFYTKAWN